MIRDVPRPRGRAARGRLRLLPVAVAALGAACGAGPRPGEPRPADIAALEARRAQTPNDAGINLRLAGAYHAARRFAEARAAVTAVLAVQPRSQPARAYLGLIHEALDHFDSARTVYAELLAERPRGDVERMLRGRLQLLARRELVYAARQTIARESLLAATPPEPNTIAVMPFRFAGRDTSLRPLERGLAALVITDLGRVRQLRVVERERIQALLDELQLAAGNRIDPATGARSGRLVRAGQVVQGQFQEVPTAAFRLDAAVIRSTDAQVAASGSDRDALRALFDVEKRVVLQLLERMGITLTPAERTAISERPTQDLQAFLLYSRGLEAQDRGDFRGAAAAFRAAAQRDPSFGAAAQQAAATEAAATAAAAPAGELATVYTAPTQAVGTPTTSTLGSAINGAVPSGATSIIESVPTTLTIEIASTGTGGTTTIGIPPAIANPLCEAAACQGPQNVALIGTIIIIIQRP